MFPFLNVRKLDLKKSAGIAFLQLIRRSPEVLPGASDSQVRWGVRASSAAVAAGICALAAVAVDDKANAELRQKK